MGMTYVTPTDMPTLQEERPAEAKRRFWIPGLSEDPNKRSIQIGLIWTVLIHLLLLLIAPQVLQEEFSPGRFVKPGTTAQTFDIQLVPPPKTPPAPMHFVETNPNANNNVPDNTRNFAAQNQQAAQPVPDKNSKSRMPKTEGRKNFKNDSQVVTGSLEKPQPPIPAPTPRQAQKKAEANKPAHAKEQVPLPGYMHSAGKNPDAFGTEAVKLPESTTHADKYVKGDKNTSNTLGAGAAASEQVQQVPLPRPRLTQVRPGILAERPVGVNNVGTIGVDAHFSQYGYYLQELIDIVQIQWERILNSSNIVPPGSTHVTIRFRLTSQGRVSEILNVDGNAGDYGTNAALSAIRDPAPYRPWTKEMVAVLGDHQDITFTFYYW